MIKSILFLFLISTINLITLNNRLNSKKCLYKLKIEPIKHSEINDKISGEKFQIFELKITEILQNEDLRDFEKEISKNFQKLQIKLKNSELFENNQTNRNFNNYTFLFENNLIYFKNSNFRIRNSNKINFRSKNKFEMEIFNLNCHLELPLLFYDKTDFNSEKKTQVITVFAGVATAQIYYFNFDFFFTLSSVNKFHLNYKRSEFLEILKDKSYDKFRSFDEQIIG